MVHYSSAQPICLRESPSRFLTLNEDFDAYGRLIQILGDDQHHWVAPGMVRRLHMAGPRRMVPPRVVDAGDTEVWEIYNPTGDVHPMHFHLVNVQVINRQPFDTAASVPFDVLHWRSRHPARRRTSWGWKETVQMYPGTVTRIIMKFDLSPIVDHRGKQITTKAIGNPVPIINGQPPVSPRTGGNEYVWHCHILEHEEHDMMRPLVVM